ncbi:hypothetical protein ONJ16_27300, partial [Salmonella enterica subsp. enterica serovar Montevideo]|nr:hypothetical protein [Salmonella enterica subsp. enterica serovar Montevideo]
RPLHANAPPLWLRIGPMPDKRKRIVAAILHRSWLRKFSLGFRYCQRKWNDSNGISVATQSSRHQSESSVSPLPLRQTFTPVKL